MPWCRPKFWVLTKLLLCYLMVLEPSFNGFKFQPLETMIYRVLTCVNHHSQCFDHQNHDLWWFQSSFTVVLTINRCGLSCNIHTRVFIAEYLSWYHSVHICCPNDGLFGEISLDLRSWTSSNTLGCAQTWQFSILAVMGFQGEKTHPCLLPCLIIWG
jgi:hypothetical protein